MPDANDAPMRCTGSTIVSSNCKGCVITWSGRRIDKKFLAQRSSPHYFRHAEALGFDVATTADQFVDWKNPSVPWFDVWTALAAVAQATDHIRLAPCVAQIPMRDPATFARQVVTVDHVSGGRVEAGLGLGLTVDPGYGMIGVPNWDNPERARRFKEYVEIVDSMLSGSPTDYAGTYYTVESATVHESVQSPRPPITIAAMGPKMMRHAATYGDTWNTMSFGSGLEALTADAAALKRKMDQACEEVGRDPSTLRHSFLMFDANARKSGGHLFYWESVERFTDVPHVQEELQNRCLNLPEPGFADS